MDNHTAFITRELGPDSVFYGMLAGAGWTVVGVSLVRLRPVPFTVEHWPEWVFFYSQNAVRFFWEGLTDAERQNLRGTSLGAIGAGTARALNALGLQPSFVGNGLPQEVAAAFAAKAAGQRVLFPRAAQSQQSVQGLAASAIKALDLVVYDNEPRPDCAGVAGQASQLVFTSPLNAQAFYACNGMLLGQRVLAIGDSTHKALLALGLPHAEKPQQPTEAALANMILHQTQS